jgi:hypothetical protein
MKAPFCFDLRTQLLDPRRMENQAPILSAAIMEALKLNERGFIVNTVSGTAIAGTRTDADTFTRSAGYWVDEVRIEHGGYTGTPQLGEEVEETTSGAKGKLKEITTTHIVIRFPITVAAFVGDKLLTGATSGFTCTGDGTITTDVTDLVGQWVWSHTSGTLTAGVWCRVVSNTSTAINVDATLHSVGTAVILFASAAAARDAYNMDLNIDEYSAMQVITATAATVTLTSTSGKHQLVIADTGSNAVKVMLPDARTLVDGTQIHIYGKDATTFALTVESPIAAQTLDGTDISSGGTPLATLNADDDYIVIEMRSNLWTTQVDGIS